MQDSRKKPDSADVSPSVSSSGEALVFPRYAVAIRTLGSAGEKFVAQLDSLHRLDPAPVSINVYIPHGYAVPPVPYSDVRFFRCDKGMVAQRALQLKEIDAEWILFLDDDVTVPPGGVAKLFRVAAEMSADCVSVDHKVVCGFWTVIKNIIVSGWWPHRDRGMAFKVGRNGEYTYSTRQVRAGTMPTECVCFQNFLVRKSAHLSIHYEEERWIDQFGYAVHDELTYAKKLIGNGWRIASCFSDDFVHLGAKSGHLKESAAADAKKLACRFATWHRNVFKTKQGGALAAIAVASFLARQYVIRGAKCLVRGEPRFFWKALLELWKTWKFLHSEPYRSLKPVDMPLPSREAGRGTAVCDCGDS